LPQKFAKSLRSNNFRVRAGANKMATFRFDVSRTARSAEDFDCLRAAEDLR
jgi:hypothetical protein